MIWDSAAVAKALGTAEPAYGKFGAISTDTRSLKSGDLFVALEGERFDGHRFLSDARAKGAGAAVVREGTEAVEGLPLYPVPDTLEAYGRLARVRRRTLTAGPVVAITGSSGKTSTKELIRAALSTRWRVHATPENLNNLVGVPQTILSAPDDTTALVIEAGASVPGEIAALRRIIEPTISVITNVGYAHVEGFGSLEGVMQEKVRLAVGVPVVVVGTEPPELATEARRMMARTVVAGSESWADVHPDSAYLDDAGHPRIRWAGAEVTVPLIGFHQIENAMIALAVAREAGVEPGAALAGLADVRVPPGRGTVRELGGLTVIDDTYNANPGSLHWALRFAQWLAGRRRRPLVVVVGSMLELGPESGRLHAAAAREIVAAQPARIAAVGAFVDAFAADAGRLGARLLTAADAEEMGPKVRAALGGNEVVLLKASRGVALERVLRHLT